MTDRSGGVINYKEIFEKKREDQKTILSVCPDMPSKSGIYFLLRDDGDFKWAYIGKAKNLLSRLVGHLSAHQHIDNSIRKRGFFSEENKGGWRLNFLLYPEEKLDEMERFYIKKYASAGYQLLNHESGGTEGKAAFDNRKPSRGYYDGLAQGYKNAQKEIAHLFELHLNVETKKNPPTKLQEKALEKFNEFLNEIR